MSESVNEGDDATLLGYAPADRRARAWNVRRVVVSISIMAVVGGGGYFIKRARDRAEMQLKDCRMNLYMLAQSADIYGNGVNGWPPDLPSLFSEIGPSNWFLCPASGATIGDPSACYVYIPGQNRNSDPRNILFYEKPGHHRHDVANVVDVLNQTWTIQGYDNVLKLVKETEERLKVAATQAGP